MPAYVALLRGINLGGHNKVPMGELRALCRRLGLEDVATYIQSGNVVFSSPLDDRAQLTGEIESAIAAAFGFDVPVVLRSEAQLGGVLGSNPFLQAGREETVLSVGFLAAEPEPARLGVLLAHPLASPPPGGDEFVVRGQEVFLHHPNGYGRSKLTNSYFDRKLGTVVTVRNWRTVTTLWEMSRGVGR
ncbi:MAG TPA: DUF1697 domain-containing protein [Acidimicrobiales bacterium]|nr:DUF1697 domain-containing protein [Acidimicrobiales bacterium]